MNDAVLSGYNVGLHLALLRIIKQAFCRAHVMGMPQDAGLAFGVGNELSAGVLNRKLDNVRRTSAQVLLTDNPGCLLHIRGGADAAGLELEVQHVAEYLAARLP